MDGKRTQEEKMRTEWTELDEERQIEYLMCEEERKASANYTRREKSKASG